MIHSQKVTALVPIKAHSERVKDKNFRLFCGKPLYHHILETLERTYAVDEVIVNTDSEHVINEAPKLFSKVRTLKRPDELCGDFVSTNKIFKHDLCYVKLRNYAIVQRANSDYIFRRSPNHLFGSHTNSQRTTRTLINSDPGGFINNNTLSAHIDESIRRSKINANVKRKETK